MTAVYALSAFARAAPVNCAWMTLMTCGIINAAPAPWAIRATMRIFSSGARPQSAEQTVKAIVPVTNSRRRPNSSPSRAPVISSIA
jgi:hypothetical protein